MLTVGRINGGIRFNIIPDSVFIEGTIRTFDPAMRKDIIERVKRTAESIAAASGATARVIVGADGNPATVNDAALMDRMLPTLQRVAGAENVELVSKVTGAEDFAYFQKLVPGVFFFVGVTDPAIDPAKAYSNHSPKFEVDESGLLLGLRALAGAACDWLEARAS